ncbi:SsgA family sporulation/cell division regulator [Nonomuraea basaltis]|uniref:SsgA family sporulation/cell division regulator n=1 Tax=Nonomuraea basaltis TaxID=2495887 RepID=UPI00110C418E|nr:SsgA family sporulation/cell division regulator [Nonomuraea basaltis]TMR97512.1 SsgA family sporulation/cell division regulator [Nonomuraea basaltis]
MKTAAASSLWAPLPLWREDDPERFVIGSLTYRTADPLLVRIDHEPGRFTAYPRALLDDSRAFATRYGNADVQPCAYDPTFLLGRFDTEGQVWRIPLLTVVAFLGRTCRAVPYGCEGMRIDWDGGLAEIAGEQP